jgi:leucyl/phenylalanyl-tRNA---protein transferase
MFINKSSIIDGYKKGIFPMSESRNDPFIFWVSPELRGIIKLDGFNISRSLKKFINKKKFSISINNNFREVIEECASPNKKRESTWINKQIIDSYVQLYEDGLASSIECYDDNELVGGLYGVHIGKIFFGESMFSIKTNASKVSLVYLAAHLIQGGFSIIDTQFLTNHLKQFGGIEIKKKEYLELLNKNINYKREIPNQLKKDVLEYF